MAQRKLNIHAHLVERLREHDAAAQFEIYQLYSKAMLNTALRITGEQAEAEDILQESFLAAFTKIHRYQGTATFGAWLKRIVVNKSINALQKKKASLIPIEDANLAHLPEKEEKISPVWNINQIMSAIESLPTGYRVVFSLYLLEGYDHREVAAILGITEGGSKSQYNRAKKKLRDILTSQTHV